MSPAKECVIYGFCEGVFTCVVVIIAAGHSVASAIAVAPPFLAGFAVVCAMRNLLRYRALWNAFEHERKREQWEMHNFPDGERKEVVELFVAEGISEKDATTAVELLSKPEYEQFFVDLMMVKELNMQMPDQSYSLKMLAMLTAAAVFLGGLLPVIGYLAIVKLSSQPLTEPVDASSLVLLVMGALLSGLLVVQQTQLLLFPHLPILGTYTILALSCTLGAASTALIRNVLTTPLFLA